ncbi:uncharacterized protein TEOVI_000388500 [Trypanosoma equiperdum]|uniref:Uncharacterized protein n=1 Tax=Trypanosoma equiperdum TaxID=5694 RepID=A0A1G4IIJ6_TRYEQ|nr:hypothetical protein, conserved [Trypanosoma equiperdum]
MRRSLTLWISKLWRPHAEHIQSLIARSVSEPRELQQARTYLHELKFEQSIEEVDDATDLLYFMHRVSYPAESHLEMKVGEFLSKCAPQVCGQHILAIGKRIQEEPGSGPLWSRVVFERGWFTSSVVAMLSTMTLEEHLTLCASYWHSLLPTPQSRCGRQLVSGSFVAVSTRLAALTAQRIEGCGDNRPCAVCLCAKLGIFLRGDTFAELRAVTLSITREMLSAAQVLEVANVLATRRSAETANSEWLVALQEALCRRRTGEVEAAHAVGLLHSMAVLNETTLSEMFEDLLLQLLPGMSQDEILKCCESLSTLSGTAPRIRTEVHRTLCTMAVAGAKGKNFVDKAVPWRLRCLSMVAPQEAGKLLGRFEENIQDAEASLSPSDTRDLIRAMRSLRVFPPRAVTLCKASYLANPLQSFNQQDAVYMMYAGARTGESATSAFFKEVVNRFTTVRKFDRRKSGPHQTSVLTAELLEMVLQALQIAKGRSLLDDARVYAVLRRTLEQLQREGSLSTEANIRLLRLLAGLNVGNASLPTVLLTNVSRALTSLTSADVRELCEVLVALKSRDVLMFRALLEHLGRCGPDRTSLTAIAVAARKLKFVTYFQQSGLLQNLTSLEGWSVSDIVLIAATCSENRRAGFLALPGADVLAQAQAEDLTTLDLFLIISIVADARKQLLSMASALSKRQPLGANDLEAEDALRAIVNVVDDKDALAAVCRSATSALQAMDENMLMRTLEAVRRAPELPNVFFRVVGRCVLRLANSMTADNAIQWLELYVKHSIRDDSVGKALLSKARTRSSNCADLTDKSIRKAAAMYGKSYALHCKLKKNKEKPEWRSFEVG